LGLRVENNVVVVDHAMNEHLLTTAEGNPSEDTVEELRVISVFQRRFNSAKLARKRDEKVIGDNCPLIYALKGKDGSCPGEWCSLDDHGSSQRGG